MNAIPQYVVKISGDLPHIALTYVNLGAAELINLLRPELKEQIEDAKDKPLPVTFPFAYFYALWRECWKDKRGEVVDIVVDYFTDVAQYRIRIKKPCGGWDPIGRPMVGWLTQELQWAPFPKLPENVSKTAAAAVHRALIHTIPALSNGAESMGPTAVRLEPPPSFRMRVRLSEPKEDVSGVTFKVEVKVRALHPYVPGLIMLDPPASANVDTFEAFLPPKDAKVLMLSSPFVRSAVYGGALAWKNQAVRNVLISAPPGSGKEEISSYLAAGFSSKRATVMLGECEGSSVGDRVCREVSKLQLSATDPSGWWRSGSRQHPEELAVEGALIGDEADKPPDEVRAALLRVLEQRTIDSTDGKRRYNLDNVLCVFNAAQSLRALKEERGPADFWTRMQKTVEMPHPLSLPLGPEFRETARDYVTLYCALSFEMLKGDKDGKVVVAPRIAQPLGYTGEVLAYQWRQGLRISFPCNVRSRLHQAGICGEAETPILTIHAISYCITYTLLPLLQVAVPSLRNLRTLV